MRGVWLTTFSNIDWPHRGETVEQQKAALRSLFDMYKVIGFNTVYFQVRSQCDAMYLSSFEPWSADLTGIQGKAPEPFWDPLQFAIEEARKRGLELHAWLNPYRAVANVNALPAFSPNHIARRKPEWLLSSGTLRILNPGKPEVRQYILNIIDDILKRYDVDGIHFDDYFYPEGGVQDQSDFNASNTGLKDIGDWRRQNVNLLIQEVSAYIKVNKPWVKFGVSPSGIYRNSSNPEIGTPTTGLQHFTELYCDSRKWINEGWVDYLVPQVYWHYTQPGSPYGVIVPWWNNQASGRHIYIGIAGYKVGVWPGWNSDKEIPKQVLYALRNGFEQIKGVSVYNTSSLLYNKKGFRDSLEALFKRPALQPLMSWKDKEPPVAPQKLTIQQEGNIITLNWEKPLTGSSEFDKAQYYAVYRSSQYPVTLDASHLLSVTGTTPNYTDLSVRTFDSVYYYVVTTLDRLQNESTPSNYVSTVRKDLPVVEYRIYRNADSSYSVKWKDSKPLNAHRYVLERSTDNQHFEGYLDLGSTSPVRLPKLDRSEHSYWYRIKREGSDVVSYSDVTYMPVILPVETQQPAATEIAETEVPEQAVEEIVKVEIAPQAPVDTVISIINEKEEPLQEEEISVVRAPEKPVVEPEIQEETEAFEDEPGEQALEVGTLSKPIETLIHGKSLRINVLVVGEVKYVLTDTLGNVVISGKIWSRSPSAYATIPASNELKKGRYHLAFYTESKKDGWYFDVKSED